MERTKVWRITLVIDVPAAHAANHKEALAEALSPIGASYCHLQRVEPLECTSDDPNDHAGQTCPIHEATF